MAEHFHYTTKVKKKEGIYTVRLYSVPVLEKQALCELPGTYWLALKPGTMDWHNRWLYGGTKFMSDSEKDPPKEYPLPSGTVKEFGDNAAAMENEFLIANPDFKSLKLSLKPCKELQKMVSAMRELDFEVWCEISLEQWVANSHVAVYPEFIWPRKQRLWFWGQLIKAPTEGSVDYQGFLPEYKGRAAMLRPSAFVDHKGNLDLEFKHWFKAIASSPVKDFLDDYKANSPLASAADADEVCGHFFERLVAWINPSFLFAATDYRLGIGKNPFGVAVEPTIFDIDLSYTLADANGKTQKNLNRIYFPARIAGDWSPLLLDNDGEFSLYKLKDVGELMTRFSEEFQLKFQCEAPCFEDIQNLNYFPDDRFNGGNNLRHWQANWQAVSRWLFLEIDRQFVDFFVRPIEKVVKYKPTATWLNKIHIDEPSPDGMDPSYAEWKHEREGGFEYTRKLLLRFIGQRYQWLSDGHGGFSYVLADDARGFELKIYDPDFLDLQFVKTASVYGDWATFHVQYIFNLWAGVRSIIKGTSRGIGVEPFGRNTKSLTANKPRGFGFYDMGDFPLLRRFLGDPGVLFEKNKDGKDVAGDYAVYDYARHPGGDFEFSAIEREQTTTDDIVVSVTPGPPDPPIIDVPPHPSEPICGVITFIFGVLYPDGCVDHADISIDGNYYGTISGFPNPMPGFVVPVGPITIDTCALGNGPHTITITLTLCDGTTISAAWNFTVNCPCGNTQKIFSFA